MDIDPYPLHISSAPFTFYRCICGNRIHDPETLTESRCFYRPLPYPFTWYVYGEEAAIVNVHDLQAYQETHTLPPSYYSQATQPHDYEELAIDEERYYTHESIDDVAILQDVNMDQMMNESFQQASDQFVGLTKKETYMYLRVMKYHQEEGEEESEV